MIRLLFAQSVILTMDFYFYISSIVYVKTIESISNVFSSLNEFVEADDSCKIDYGLDTEFTTDQLCTVQVAVKGRTVIVADIFNAGVTSANVPASMKKFFELDKMVPTGRNVGNDVGKLSSIGINVTKWTELRGLALLAHPDSKTGLDDLAERYLGVALDKSGQTAEYKVHPKLPDWLVQYAAIDAIVSLLILRRIRQVLSMRGKLDGRSLLVEAPGGIRSGVMVQFHQRGSSKATAEVVFVGGRGGETRKWGKKTIGKNLALIRLTEVTCKGARPPHSYEVDPNDSSGSTGWSRKDKTLADLLLELEDPVIAVSTASLHIPIDGTDSSEEAIDRYFPLAAADGTEGNSNDGTDSEHAGGTEATSITAPDATTITVPDAAVGDASLGPLVLEIDESDDGEGCKPRSRQKEDVFHQFQDLPLPKTCPARHFITELNILATFRMDKKYYDPWAQHLAEKEGLVLQNDLMRHFIHNKELWRQHVPMYTPKADEHAAMMRSVHHIIKADKELQKYYTDDLKEYYESFEDRIRRGWFEEIEDVIMHEQKGHDKHGLPIFIRKRGTVRAENIHQKMKVAIGPWGIGARSAHYLLVLLIHRYNVASNIRRRGHHNFGHCELWLIDRIQIRIREIYNVLIYPRHPNVMEFKPIDMVSVGIAPLSYDADFVDKGPPDPKLRGDVKFIAEQTGLVLPLFPIATKEEIKIFTEFMGQYPQPTDANFKILAKRYKAKANGDSVFPKLPSMVKSYYSRWKKNQEIKTSIDNVGAEALAFRESLFRKSASADEFHGDAILKEVEDKKSETAEPVVAVVGPRQQEVHVQAPPIAAPAQAAYVPPTNITVQRRCAWYPLCQSMISECGGSIKKRCRNNSQLRGREEECRKRKEELANQVRKEKRAEEQREKKKRKRDSISNEINR